MTAIETRLSGRHATVAGIVRAIHQNLGQGPLARVELRYSTLAVPPLVADEARAAMANLLREHGQDAALVSVRAHGGPIADASGEHLLRLVPAEGSLRPIPPVSTSRGWRNLLARWGLAVPGATPVARAAARAAPGVRVEPGLAQPQAQPYPQPQPQHAAPAIPVTQAVAQLRLAVQKATAYVETDGGDLMLSSAAAANGLAVGLARVIVRHSVLNSVLEPLVRQDTQAIADMIKAGGLAPAAGFAVSYQFKPAQAGDGTGYAHETDLDVRLVLAAAPVAGASQADTRTEPTGCQRAGAPGDASALPPPRTPTLPVGPKADDPGTALAYVPQPAPAPAPAPALTVRVLGTVDEPFAKPFDLCFASLPARLDRRALQQAGFERAHPGLLAVASNSCPLLINPTPSGALYLQASVRSDGRGGAQPMYHHRGTLQPLQGDVVWTADSGLLVVNAPGGSVCPSTGRRLPALVVQLQTPGWAQGGVNGTRAA